MNEEEPIELIFEPDASKVRQLSMQRFFALVMIVLAFDITLFLATWSTDLHESSVILLLLVNPAIGLFAALWSFLLPRAYELRDRFAFTRTRIKGPTFDYNRYRISSLLREFSGIEYSDVRAVRIFTRRRKVHSFVVFPGTALLDFSGGVRFPAHLQDPSRALLTLMERCGDACGWTLRRGFGTRSVKKAEVWELAQRGL